MALASSQIALTAASTYSQYQTQRSQGKFQQQIADSNAKFADLNAADALARGEKSAQNENLKTRGAVGAGRAAAAASGVDANSGSALDVQEDTAGRGAMDALTIRNNAWREAWGYGVQAQNYRTQGQLDRIASKNNANSTLLTGGLQAVTAGIGGYDRYKQAGGAWKGW